MIVVKPNQDRISTESGLGEMDAIYSLKLYFDQLVSECGIGMKVLLMDNETASTQR